MTAHLNVRGACALTRERLRQEGRDPGEYDVFAIVREAFHNYGDLGRELNPEAWDLAVQKYGPTGPTEGRSE